MKCNCENYKDGEAICIIWTIGDAIEQAKDSHGLWISDEQAKVILDRIYKNRDANIGINWEILDIHIQELEKEINSG